jgi:peptide/nickel transport system ATP-binding protein
MAVPQEKPGPRNGPGDGGAETLLSVQDLTVRFPTADGTVDAVRGLTYTLAAHEVLGIVGESGSGKSASSLAVLGLLPPTARVAGTVTFRGRDVLGMRSGERRSLRGRRIAMIFQDPLAALNPVHTVGDQLVEAVRAHQAVSRKAARARAADMLDLVGLPRPEGSLGAYPHELSGGMRQRVLIAMAVINEPDVIIADEPTTALDVTVQAQILDTLIAVKDAVAAAIVLITHDLGVIAGMADRVLVMYAGRAVETGGTARVFASPRMPYTVGLLGSVPTPDSAGGQLWPIPGAPPSLIDLPEGCPFSPRCPLAADRCRQEEPRLVPADGRGHHVACHRWAEVAGRDVSADLFRGLRPGPTGGPG